MKKIVFAILVLLLFAPPARSRGNFNQQKQHLLKQLSVPKSDSAQITLLFSLSKGYYTEGNYDSALLFCQRLFRFSKKQNQPIGIRAAYTLKGAIYFDFGDYPTALKNYFKALKTVDQNTKPQTVAAIYNDIGNAFRSQENYKQALAYQQKGLAIRERVGDKRGVAMSQFNIAHIYKDQGQTERALNIYRQLLKVFEEGHEERGLRYTYNNVGNIQLDQGHYPEALNSFRKVLAISRTMRDSSSIAFSSIGIGNAYTSLRQPDSARFWLEKGLRIGRDLQIKKILRSANLSLFQLDSLQGNFKQALHHFYQYTVYKDSLFNDANVRKMTEMRLRFNFKQKEAAAQIAHEHALSRTRLRWGILVLIVLAGAVIGFALFLITKIKKKKERQILMARQQVLALEKQRLDKELQQARQNIQQFLKDISEKNSLIERISAEWSKLKDASGQEALHLKKALAELKQTTILTNDDWLSFLSNFNQVYPEFSIKIKDKFPDITKGELRYLMLSKLGLGHPEMANAQGVSSDSVRVTWNRVRHKLGGDLEDTPQSILNKIDVG